MVDRVGHGQGHAPKAATSTSAEAARDERGLLYTVKKGDTLIRIALEYGQNYHDLVAWNNLSNPNDIKVDQVLRVQPLDAVAAGSGVQTSSISMPPSDSPSPAVVVRKTAPRGRTDLFEPQRPEGGAPLRAEPGKMVDRNGDGIPDGPVVAAKVAHTPAVPPASTADEDKLSWIWPSDGKVIATFDEGKNKGIDIAGRAGQQVMAAGSGKVMYAGSGIRGYGNLVIVKHSNSLLSAYAHNRTILVKEGQSVNKGQTIAEMGNSDADGVKLHFEIRQQGKPVDPTKFLPNR